MYRYPGTKKAIGKMLSTIVKPQTGVYREPFAGSASVFNELAQSKIIDKAVLTDLNGSTVNMLKQLKKNPDEVIGAVVSKLESYNPEVDTPHDFMLSFAKEGDVGSKTEKAIRDLILTSIVNKAPGQELSYARSWGIPNPNRVKEFLTKMSESLQIADVKQGDWKTNLPGKRENSFTMLDPPYVGSHKGKNYDVGTAKALQLNKEIASYIQNRGAKNSGIVFNTPVGIENLYKEFGSVVDFSTGKVKQPAVLYGMGRIRTGE